MSAKDKANATGRNVSKPATKPSITPANPAPKAPTETIKTEPMGKGKTDAVITAFTLTRDNLISTAKEMNGIMGLEKADAISVTSKVDVEYLKAQIVLHGKDLEADDFIYLPADGDDPEFIPFSDTAKEVFTALEVLIPLKPKAVVKDDLGKKVKAEVKAKAESKPKYTRPHAFADAVMEAKGHVKLDTLAEKANALYVTNGGKDDKVTAKAYNDIVINAMVQMKLAEIKDGFLTLKK